MIKVPEIAMSRITQWSRTGTALDLVFEGAGISMNAGGVTLAVAPEPPPKGDSLRLSSRKGDFFLTFPLRGVKLKSVDQAGRRPGITVNLPGNVNILLSER